MKNKHFFIIFLFCLGIIGFLNGCLKEDKNFLYKSSNCADVKRHCLKQCHNEGKLYSVCLDECEKARGMCEAIKTKGCMQDCNLQYGKGTQGAEQCKKRCVK